MKYSGFLVLSILLMGGLLFANNNGLNNLQTQLATIIAQLKGVATLLGLLMLVGAGAVYAGGQMMGAEMRSRSISWAHSLLIGGVIGIILGVSACGIACFVGKLSNPNFQFQAPAGGTAPCTCQ